MSLRKHSQLLLVVVVVIFGKWDFCDVYTCSKYV